MARIGLFGGTFNPIHAGHLMIAEEARLAAKLDRVILVPTGESYMKDQSDIAPKQARLHMARLAAAAYGFEVSDMEIRRSGPSYTCETVAAFRALYPGDELFLILGADSLMDMERWRSPGAIFAGAGVLAMARGGVPDGALREKADELRDRFGARVEIHGAFSLGVSSSEIRALIRGGHAFRPLLPEAVGRYIEENGLYKSEK